MSSIGLLIALFWIVSNSVFTVMNCISDTAWFMCAAPTHICTSEHVQTVAKHTCAYLYTHKYCAISFPQRNHICQLCCSIGTSLIENQCFAVLSGISTLHHQQQRNSPGHLTLICLREERQLGGVTEEWTFPLSLLWKETDTFTGCTEAELVAGSLLVLASVSVPPAQCVSLAASLCAWQVLAHGANPPSLERAVKAHLFVLACVSHPSFGIAVSPIWGLDSQLQSSAMRQRMWTSWGVLSKGAGGAYFWASGHCKGGWGFKLAYFVQDKCVCFLYTLCAQLWAAWMSCEWQVTWLCALLGSPPDATWFICTVECGVFFL